MTFFFLFVNEYFISCIILLYCIGFLNKIFDIFFKLNYVTYVKINHQVLRSDYYSAHLIYITK